MIKTARFWVFHCEAWVKLSLRDGETVQFGEFSRDYEGYNSTRETITRDGIFLYSQREDSASGCDGRVETFSQYRSTIFHIQTGMGAFDIEGQNLRRVSWGEDTETDREVNDHFARAMNY